ncbi:MAG: DDE-type integrase/transposase/recombinase [Phycisphaerae bacterium]|nr:DDE-type integrase/transposase/recombinase [Phycisphaerae bacterium]
MGRSGPAPTPGLPDVIPPKRDEAIRKLGLIAEGERFASAHVREGGLWSDGIAAYCRQMGISLSTFKRWRKRKKEEGLLGLVDGRGGRVVAEEAISPEAWEIFKGIFLDARQPTLKGAWQILCYLNTKEKHGWRVPKYPSMARYVKANIPYPAMVLHREGVDAYEAKCSPHIELDPDSVAPGEVWVGDHHQFNCMIFERGQWVRPWITAWQDWRSRMIVGGHVSLGPNQTTVLRAMGPAIKEYGPPDGVVIDNGRDYDSQMWTGVTKADRKSRKVLRAGYLDQPMLSGIYAQLGIGVTFCIPYRAKAKRIERWFDTLDKQFTKFMPTYTGKDCARKPEDLTGWLATDAAIAEADDLKSFAAKVAEYIETFNNMLHTGVGMDRTPAQVMATRESRRVVLDDSLALLMRVWSGPLKIGKNGVRLNGVYYGQYDTRLLECQGRTVRAAYDPDDLRQVDVYDAATMQLITRAEANRQLGYAGAVDEAALREAMRQQARAKKNAKAHRDTAVTAHMDVGLLAQRAMAEQRQPVKVKPKKMLARPVVTPMDGQAAAHAAAEQRLSGKKAAGVPKLEFDYSLWRREEEEKPEKILNLFGQGA